MDMSGQHHALAALSPWMGGSIGSIVGPDVMDKREIFSQYRETNPDSSDIRPVT
jgi:hypothetical protein